MLEASVLLLKGLRVTTTLPVKLGTVAGGVPGDKVVHSPGLHRRSAYSSLI